MTACRVKDEFQTVHKDKIYVCSSFKQFCLPFLEFPSAVAMYSSVVKCYYGKSNFSDPEMLDFEN